MYFVRICQNEGTCCHGTELGKKATKLTPSLYQVKFSISDIFHGVKEFLCIEVLRKNKQKVMSRSEIIFDKGMDIVNN